MRNPTRSKLSPVLNFALLFPCFNYLGEKEIKCASHGSSPDPLLVPVEQPLRIADTGTAVLNVLIARAVVSAAFGIPETRKGRKPVAKRVLIEHPQQHLRKLTDTCLIIGIAEVNNLPIAFPSFVFNDAKEALNAILDIREAAFLFSTVNQQDGAAFNKI
jgi:hypothetical protein